MRFPTDLARVLTAVLLFTLASCGDDSDGNGAAAGGPNAGGSANTSGGTGNDAGAATDGGGDGAAGSAGQPSTSDTIGPDGGTISIAGVTLVIPPGALEEETTITIREASSEPSGFELVSPAFEFEPEGLSFAIAATVTMDFAGAPSQPAVFWTDAAGTGFEELTSTIEGDQASAPVTHFSTGFVADAGEAPGDLPFLVYGALKDGLRYTVWSVNRDGTGEVQLTPGSVLDVGYRGGWALSPDGTKLAFAGDPDITGFVVNDCYIVDVRGGEPLMVSDGNGECFDPWWSPNGDFIIYWQAGNLFKVNADGSDRVELGQGVGSERNQQVLSPDGTRVAFTTISPREVYTVRVDGTGRARIDDDPGVLTRTGWRWSPNGTHIALRGDASGDATPDSLWVAPADGSSLQLVSAPVDTLPVGAGLTSALETRTLWSPNSVWLAYVGDHITSDVFELFSVAVGASGGGLVSKADLMIDADVRSTFYWSPDSQFIAFVGNQEQLDRQELFITRPQTPDVRRVNLPSGQIDPGLQADNEGRWAPDSSRIAFTYDAVTPGIHELYVVGPDGVAPVRISAPLEPASGGGSEIQQMSWAPDSSALVYVAVPEGAVDYAAFVAPVTGGALQISDAGFSAWPDARWTPDSSSVVYRLGSATSSAELWVADRDGSNPIKLSGAFPDGGYVEDFTIIGTQ